MLPTQPDETQDSPRETGTIMPCVNMEETVKHVDDIVRVNTFVAEGNGQ